MSNIRCIYSFYPYRDNSPLALVPMQTSGQLEAELSAKGIIGKFPPLSYPYNAPSPGPAPE